MEYIKRNYKEFTLAVITSVAVVVTMIDVTTALVQTLNQCN